MEAMSGGGQRGCCPIATGGEYTPTHLTISQSLALGGHGEDIELAELGWGA